MKIRRNSCGKFYIPQNQNCDRDKYFRIKQRGSRDYLAQRNGQRVCVLGHEEVSFLTLLPTGGGGGGIFIPHHHSIGCHSETT